MRVGAVLAVVAAVAAATGLATAATRPALRLVASSPPTFRGSGFRPREAVRVLLQMGERRLTERTTAGATGAFVVRFARVRLDRCALPFVVEATGTRSGTVAARLPPAECAAP